MEKISAILIEKGPDYPEIVLERLDIGFFDEILIVVDSPSVYKRYEAAAQAKNPIVYVQDSDCMVNYQVLFSKYNGQITNALPKEFEKKYGPEIGCTLVGWGCYFPKSMLGVFDKYIAKYGVDKHLLREADRIFTYLNKPFNTIVLPHEDLFQEGQRMCRESYHYQSAQEALEKAKSLI